MGKQVVNNVKLGVFVIAGLLFLVLLLYMIGRNSHLFGNTYELKARFSNIQGLVIGNNVRYSGIEAGTVKKIEILNDTVIEVTMFLDTKMKTIIRKNARVTIGTAGLVGNKVVNISPAREPAALAMEGDCLIAQKSIDSDEMMQKLGETNDDIAVIANDLKITLRRLQASTGVWHILEDPSLPAYVKGSLSNVHTATQKVNELMDDLQTIVTDVQNGQGSLGQLLKDTAMVQHINSALLELKAVGHEADSLVDEINAVVSQLDHQINQGDGLVQTILNDSIAAQRFSATLQHLQKGTAKFDQNMEAMKHNFLFRGYFRKQEREARKAAGK
jgi:phospholipid/cholesterol/gamma-HCH transport system substrate-binding protein